MQKGKDDLSAYEKVQERRIELLKDALIGMVTQHCCWSFCSDKPKESVPAGKYYSHWFISSNEDALSLLEYDGIMRQIKRGRFKNLYVFTNKK
jgi:hypothetical protein